MKYLGFLFLMLFYTSIYSQIDSVKYYFVSSEYQKAIFFAEKNSVSTNLTLIDVKYLCLSYKVLGDYRKAISIIEKYDAIYKNSKELAFLKSEILLKYGRSYQAQKVIEQLLLTDSTNTKYLNLAERIYKYRKDFKLALKMANQLYLIDSSSIIVNYKRAYYLAKLKIYDKSLVALYKTIELDSTYVDALRWMAKIYSAHLESDSAIKYIDKAINYEPENITAYEERANIYYRKHYYFRAIKDFQRLEGAHQAKRIHRYKIGVCYQQMRQPDNALKVLKSIWREDSTDHKCAKALGFTYYDLKQFEKSRFYFEKSLKLIEPDKFLKASIYQQLVNVNYSINNKKEIDKALDGLFENSNAYFILYDLAYKYDEGNKKSLALEYYIRYSKMPKFVESRSYEAVKRRIQQLKEDNFAKQK